MCYDFMLNIKLIALLLKVVSGKIFYMTYNMKDERFFIPFLFKIQVLAKQQLDLLTSKAWLSENKQLEQRVTYYMLLVISLLFWHQVLALSSACWDMAMFRGLL